MTTWADRPHTATRSQVERIERMGKESDLLPRGLLLLVREVSGREVESLNELSMFEATRTIRTLEKPEVVVEAHSEPSPEPEGYWFTEEPELDQLGRPRCPHCGWLLVIPTHTRDMCDAICESTGCVEGLEPVEEVWLP